MAPARPVDTHLAQAATEGMAPPRGDHGLGGDAVPQVGGAADHVPLDHGDLGAEPGGVGGGRVARGSAADDHEAGGHGDPAYRWLHEPHRCRSGDG